MTETQPDPQVVAWMHRHLRDNPGASRVDLMRGYRNADSSVSLRELNDAAEAVLYPQPRTVADIPAGQGPASLFIDRDLDGSLGAWFKNADGWRELVMYEPVIKTPGRDAIWDHLAATLPHVTTEEPQIRSVDAPDGVRHYDATGREYRAVEADGELTYEPLGDAP